ncbi:hypothetical protein [Aquimarina sp. AU474]|uniref:hypothetical protein n=1 Tax=Aquimarina sp. AU474 TaxID=2108529 RepID=UPI00135855EF|nr:hypothetical protein [Aquimarina sp. AU474]
MKNTIRILYIVNLLIYLLFPCSLFSQTIPEEGRYYVWFDQIFGEEHTGLYNGRQYVDLDVNKIYEDKHSFFSSDKVLFGTVRYDDQTYYNVGMKYNLETDAVLITLKPGAVTSILQLIPDKIQSFKIDGHSFVRLENPLMSENLDSGFFEIITKNNNFTLYKKNRKVRRKRLEELGGSKIYYEFTENNKYLLFIDETYINVTSKNSVTSLFPEIRQEIRSFYSIHKSLKKSNIDVFMRRLFEQVIHTTQSKNNL